MKKNMGKESVTYKELYDFVDTKTGKIYERLDGIEKQLNIIQGQKAMIPFVVSSAVGIFFTIVNIVLAIIPKQ